MKLPIHLNALRAFEASARHQSFSAAADELNVTPAAVGQLVKTLEDRLGVTLFIRSRSGGARLIITEVAKRALPDIRDGFDRLSLGLERLKEGEPHGVLTVAVSPAFASKWLLPRIERFQLSHPNTDVRLDTNLKPVDFALHGIDIGVRYGNGNWPGLISEKLMDEEIFPVCSPGLMRNGEKLETLDALEQVVLIHDLSMDAKSGFVTWNTWLKKAGVELMNASRGLKINSSAAVLQAAIEGRGVALARSVMAGDDLAAGRLLKLFPDVKTSSDLAYYIVNRTEHSSLPRIVAFRDWLRSEASRS